MRKSDLRLVILGEAKNLFEKCEIDPFYPLLSLRTIAHSVLGSNSDVWEILDFHIELIIMHQDPSMRRPMGPFQGVHHA